MIWHQSSYGLIWKKVLVDGYSIKETAYDSTFNKGEINRRSPVYIISEYPDLFYKSFLLFLFPETGTSAYRQGGI